MEALVLPHGYKQGAGSEAAYATSNRHFRAALGHSHIGQDGVSGKLQQTMLQDEEDNEAIEDAELQMAYAELQMVKSPPPLLMLAAVSANLDAEVTNSDLDAFLSAAPLNSQTFQSVGSHGKCNVAW